MAADVGATLAALADPARRAIVEELGGGPRRSSELADALGVSRPAMSRHLGVLRRAGLVEHELVESDARARLVHLCREPFDGLRAWLADVEGFWGAQLRSFRAHAERKRGKRRR